MHSHGENKGKRLLAAIGLNFLITVVQVIGGLFSNSLALISDALHNLSDGTALLIAWLAGKYAERKADARKTFGYRRAEILAAFLNGIILVGVIIFLFVEAYQRFMHPEPIKGLLMVVVASIGLLANLAAVALLRKHATESLNIRAAYLHLFADTISSVAVIVGGVLMWQFGWYWIDPLITVLIGIYILRETYGILRETMDILMQAAPREIELNALQADIQAMPGIRNMHHVHIWRLDDESIHFEAHISLTSNVSVLDTKALRDDIESLLEAKYNIDHVTLQVEFEEGCDDGMINQTHQM